MNTIVTQSDRRFSLNGINYLKNYVSQVHGDNIIIFNCYENKDVLVELTHYSQIKVNGSVYASAITLQTALLDVLYSRGTLGGDNNGYAVEQNNIGKIYDLGYFENAGDIYASIVSLVNTYKSLSITEKDSPVILSILKYIRPDWAPATGPFNGTISPVSKHGFLFLGGKGNWGLGGTPIKATMLYALPPESLTVNDIENNPVTQVKSYGALTTQTVTQWLNTRSPGLGIQAQDDGYTLFKGTVNGLAKAYLWLGAAGIYGSGNLQSSDNDFQELNSEAVQIASIHKPVKIINESTLGFVNGVYTIQQTDKDLWLSFNIANNFTIKAPAFAANTLLEGESVGDGQATFTTVAGINLRYAISELPKTSEKNSVFGLKYRTTNEIFLYGRLQLL